MKCIFTKGEATSISLLPTTQPVPVQASADPPQEDASLMEYDDNREVTEASRGRRSWRSIVKKTWNVFKPVVVSLGVAAGIFRTVVDLADLINNS